MITPSRATLTPAAAIHPVRPARTGTAARAATPGNALAPTAAPHSRQNCAPATAGWPQFPQLLRDSEAPHELQKFPLVTAPQAGQILVETEVTTVLASSESCGSKVSGEYRTHP